MKGLVFFCLANQRWAVLFVVKTGGRSSQGENREHRHNKTRGVFRELKRCRYKHSKVRDKKKRENKNQIKSKRKRNGGNERQQLGSGY